MLDDEPFAVGLPVINEGVTRVDFRAVVKCERVKAGVDSGFSEDANVCLIDLSARFFQQKMLKIIDAFGASAARFIGNRRQQNRVGRVEIGDGFRISRGETCVPLGE